MLKYVFQQLLKHIIYLTVEGTIHKEFLYYVPKVLAAIYPTLKLQTLVHTTFHSRYGTQKHVLATRQKGYIILCITHIVT